MTRSSLKEFLGMLALAVLGCLFAIPFYLAGVKP